MHLLQMAFETGSMAWKKRKGFQNIKHQTSPSLLQSSERNNRTSLSANDIKNSIKLTTEKKKIQTSFS